MADKASLVQALSFFDVTNLVVGSVIGADIYIAASFGAGLLGPASLVAWLVAGFMAMFIALCFVECASYLAEVGGPYAYAKEVWGKHIGFSVGWSLWLAEWISLAVFPIAFVRYLSFFMPNLNYLQVAAVKLLFIVFLTVTNLLGVKAAGKTNDFLTIAKIGPLIFIAAAGFLFVGTTWSTTSLNYNPFAPLGWSGFGDAVILIFWAYAGFELSTVPAGEIREPRKTIPRAVAVGMLIVLVFYLATNVVILGVEPWQVLAQDSTPLVTSGSRLMSILDPNLAWIGAVFIGVGALVSISGADESGTLGTSRVAYAMAADGLFPGFFGKIHHKYKTPYMSLIVQNATAYVVSLFGTINRLIELSVFYLIFTYAVTCASVVPLQRKSGVRIGTRRSWLFAVAGLGCCAYLLSRSTPENVLLGILSLLLGLPIYVKYAPKKEVSELKATLVARETVFARRLRTSEVFLGHLLSHLRRSITELRKRGTSKCGP